MTPSTSDRPRSQQDQFQRDLAVRYDLTTPPASAQQLGVRDGEISGAFNRDGDQYWTYDITLPGGKVFTTQGFGHVATVDNGQPRTFPGNGVTINSRHADVEAAINELDKAVPLFGFNARDVQDWAAQARATPAQAGDLAGFIGKPQGYLTVAVEVRRSRQKDEVVLNWDFTWDQPDPTQSSSASTPPLT